MDSGNDQYDIASLEILNKCHLDLYPKKQTIYDDYDCSFIEKQIPLLSGEYSQYIGRTGKLNEDILILTNYRLFLSLNNETSFINFPLMLIDTIEVKEIFHVYVYLKNIKTIKLTFATSEKCLLWYQRLLTTTSRLSKLDELFAFIFYSWCTYEKQEESMIKMDFDKYDSKGLLKQEYKRMEFDETLWRISASNSNYKLCQTYPEVFIVPQAINDEQIQKVATFRSSRRFPTVVWRSKHNGCVLARSSQPSVGLLAWRECADEALIKAIANNCFASQQLQTAALTATTTTAPSETATTTATCSNNILLIIDARCKSVALANRVKGGGYEYSEYYTNCEIQFMNLENIHVIRSSYQSLRQLCQQVTDNKAFLSQLENTKWLHHLSAIIKAARTVVYTIDRQARPVLVHCSDGWDRTPQILCLAKLLLDPYYRTINGFQTLIEIDWLMYGHKFAQRNGHAINHTDTNERCPVFLQWLDCVYQLSKQFPCAFEFNELFLLKLCIHSYSCLFGTFLCDSHEERLSEHIHDRTFSIWTYLNNSANKQFINYLYDETTTQHVLYPSYELVNLELWYRLYCDTEVQFLTNCDVKPAAVTTTATIQTQTTSNGVQASMAVLGGSGGGGGATSVSVPIKVTDEVDSLIGTSNGVSSTDTAASVHQTAQQAVSSTASSSLLKTQPQPIQKTRSFSDFSKCSSVTGGSNGHLHTNATNFSNDNLHVLTNGDPIQIRRCSEPSLLADALENLNCSFNNHSSSHNCTNAGFVNHEMSQSPLNNHHILFRMPSTSNAANTAHQPATTTSSSSLSSSSGGGSGGGGGVGCGGHMNGHYKPPPMVAAATATATATLINSDNSSLHFDQTNKELVKYNASSSRALIHNPTTTTATMPIMINNHRQQQQQQLMQRSNDTLTNCDQTDGVFAESTENQHPKRDTSNEQMPPQSSPGDEDWQLKSVSTSTSGLNDYIVSTKFRVINDTIKRFEQQTFNNYYNTNYNSISQSSLNFLSSSPSSYGTTITASIAPAGNAYTQLCTKSMLPTTATTTTTAAAAAASHFNNTSNQIKSMKLAAQQQQQQKFNARNRSNRSSISNGYFIHDHSTMNGSTAYLNGNNSNNNNCNGNSRSLNNSFIIDDYVQRKLIANCLDIDGLTLVNDNRFKRIIDRELEHKKEIESLKMQVHNCKLFLNNLSTKVLWNDLNHDFSMELDKKHDDSRFNSLNNDSTCSSWDEVEEREFRTTTWVPDHYVTHCQNCNQKFSSLIRKHHCRNCGQVFCYKCANQYFPIPSQNLIKPARVCVLCKPIVEQSQAILTSSSSSTASSSSDAIRYELAVRNGTAGVDDGFQKMSSPSLVSMPSAAYTTSSTHNGFNGVGSYGPTTPTTAIQHTSTCNLKANRFIKSSQNNHHHQLDHNNTQKVSV